MYNQNFADTALLLSHHPIYNPLQLSSLTSTPQINGNINGKMAV